MKRLISGLLLVGAILGSVAFAGTDEVSYFGTNTGGKSGAFVKTDNPNVSYFFMDAQVTQAGTSELAAGQALLQVLEPTAGNFKLYIAGRSKFSDVYYYRTVELGKVSTWDAITAQ